MNNAEQEGKAVNEFMKVGEVAYVLGVKAGRVYQLIASGDIPSFRMGRRIVVPRRAWDRWLEQKSCEATAATERPANAG